MSINHISSGLPETLWWAQHHPPMMEQAPKTASSKHKAHISQPADTLWPNNQLYYHDHHQPATTTAAPMFCGRNPSFNFNLNQEDDEDLDEQLTDDRENFITKDEEDKDHHGQEQEIPKEPMFEKPLTPSDVGKLNRLVIPKQHAEKYFPLGGGDSGDKGLLLSFEDESGKSWRFRYSYWNSSQSYVLTKGWSRFVKEKRLDAGDTVLFERHRVDGDRLFIGWRRRTTAAPGQDSTVAQPAAVAGGGGGGGGGWTRVFYSAHPYPSHPQHGPPLPYQPDGLHAGSVMQNQTTPSGNSKRLRLFGVNLECYPDESELPTPDGSSTSSHGGQAHHQYYSSGGDSIHHNRMQDHINFSGDVNQMRYRQR